METLAKWEARLREERLNAEERERAIKLRGQELLKSTQNWSVEKVKIKRIIQIDNEYYEIWEYKFHGLKE